MKKIAVVIMFFSFCGGSEVSNNDSLVSSTITTGVDSTITTQESSTISSTTTTLAPTTTSAPTTTTTTILDISDNSGDKVYDIDLNTLFFEDYYAVKWNQETITWNFAEEQIVTAYEEKEYSVIKPTQQSVAYTTNAFQLWDDALDSINIEQSQNPDNADITIGIIDNVPGRNHGYWESVWDENNEIIYSTIIIEKNLTGALYLTTILHEIGNVLGLGDISPRQDIKSIQEDPFPEIFVGSSLWEFDVQMIKQLYGENNN